MSKGNHSKKTAEALAVVNDASGKITDRTELAAFQKVTAEQAALITTSETSNVIRRILVGIALWRIKNSLKHGEWGAWQKAHLDLSATQLHYVMNVATVFVDEAKLAKSEKAAIHSRELTLDTKDATARKVVIAADKFVGGLTWGELLVKHNIRDNRKLGGARPKGTTEGDGAPSNEQLYLFARDEIGGLITQAETLFLKENRLQHLADHPEEIAGVVNSLRSLADKVESAAAPLLKK